jgi:hypothetical protein
MGLKKYIPHASKQLNKTTVSESHRNDDIGFLDTPYTDVNERQDESRQGESAQSKGSGVGELALCSWFVKTRLKLTTECWESCRFTSVQVCEWVASIVVTSALFGSEILPIDTGSGGICSGCLIILIELGVRRSIGHCDGVFRVRMSSIASLCVLDSPAIYLCSLSLLGEGGN